MKEDKFSEIISKNNFTITFDGGGTWYFFKAGNISGPYPTKAEAQIAR